MANIILPFLTKKGGIQKSLKFLIHAKSGYQKLLNILIERNKLLFEVQPLIDNFIRENSTRPHMVYQNDNLLKIIGFPSYFRLKSLTEAYIETIDEVIEDCYRSFSELSEYIKINFCGYLPLNLDIKEKLNIILQEIIKKNNKE